MLRDPTVAGFAAALRESGPGNGAVVSLANGADGRVLFIIGSDSRFIDIVTAMQPGPSAYKLDAYGLQEQRLLPVRPCSAAWRPSPLNSEVV